MHIMTLKGFVWTHGRAIVTLGVILCLVSSALAAPRTIRQAPAGPVGEYEPAEPAEAPEYGPLPVSPVGSIGLPQQAGIPATVPTQPTEVEAPEVQSQRNVADNNASLSTANQAGPPAQNMAPSSENSAVPGLTNLAKTTTSETPPQQATGPNAGAATRVSPVNPAVMIQSLPGVVNGGPSLTGGEVNLINLRRIVQSNVPLRPGRPEQAATPVQSARVPASQQFNPPVIYLNVLGPTSGNPLVDIGSLLNTNTANAPNAAVPQNSISSRAYIGVVLPHQRANSIAAPIVNNQNNAGSQQNPPNSIGFRQYVVNSVPLQQNVPSLQVSGGSNAQSQNSQPIAPVQRNNANIPNIPVLSFNSPRFFSSAVPGQNTRPAQAPPFGAEVEPREAPEVQGNPGFLPQPPQRPQAALGASNTNLAPQQAMPGMGFGGEFEPNPTQAAEIEHPELGLLPLNAAAQRTATGLGSTMQAGSSAGNGSPPAGNSNFPNSFPMTAMDWNVLLQQ